MAPARGSSQPKSSQTKKQATISSFFAPKPQSTPKPSASLLRRPATPVAPAHPDPTPASQETPQDKRNDLALDSDEEPTVTQRRASRRLKRVLDEDDSDVENEPPDPKKTKRIADEVDTRPPVARDEEKGRQGKEVLKEQGQACDGVSPSRQNAVQKLKASDRTARFLFSSSSSAVAQQEPESEETRRKKERLHHAFVKKLGQPNSIAEIKRRNHVISDEAANGDNEVDEEEMQEEEPPPKAKGKKGVAAKKGASKLTPMEKQVVEIKRKHMDTILVVEVGYKFRFFGEDARVAARALGIVCIPGKLRYDEHPSEAHLDRFASASIPVHRLHVHVKRLVTAGHKVGVVRQLETAALKAAGDNRNAPFVRKLTNLYTKGTYIDDVEGLEGPVAGPAGGAPATGYLLCLTETNAKGWGSDERVHVGIVAVQPATGDIIYDDFEDGFMRSEIETRLLHIAPCEFLIVGELSKATEKLVQHLSSSKTNVFGDKARVERVEKKKRMAAEAYSHISNFYAGKMKTTSNGDSDERASHVLDKVHQLSEHVTVCLSAMITHMSEYSLEHVFDLTKYFQPFSARSHMLLNGNTLTSLEIYQNQTDHTEKGSLFWTMDQTKTRFGQRLLRKWVGRPLLDKQKLEERIAAVEELRESEGPSIKVDKLKDLLSRIKGDLERSLIRIYYKKCSRPELLGVLQTLQKVAAEYMDASAPSKTGFQSSIINAAIAALPKIYDHVVNYLDKINPQAARKDDKYGFFREESETESITDHKMGIASVEHELDDHRNVAAEKLKRKMVEYTTVSGIDYLIEVENTALKNVPASWAKISGTKKVSRFHTPEVLRLLRERDQHKESLANACDQAFTAMLADISSKYQEFRDCIQSLATLDCLLSLAEISNRPGYCKPIFSTETEIAVEGGRHPMVEQLLLDTYVPNRISLSQVGTRALLITGPNMGGKSSYVRSVALICIMGQIGSYVPATSARLGMLDAVFTRMGAFDNMMKGESTFMVELSETADILKQATPRSLVLLDELGRGTSTHDGVAIATAVLDYVVRDLKSLTLFITHYQNLARMAAAWRERELLNVHMRFEESGDNEKNQEITFLYEVAEGVAHRSYGLNVARLANVPQRVLDLAAIKSREMEEGMRRRKLGYLSRVLGRLVVDGDEQELEQLVSGIEQL